MIVVAHIGAVPLEELLPSLGGAGAALLLARGWLTLHLRQVVPRRRKEPRGADADVSGRAVRDAYRART